MDATPDGGRRGNIYWGIVSSIEGTTATVDYGEDRPGMLPLTEVVHGQAPGPRQGLIVQVSEDAQAVTLTTFIRLTGRCVVLMANTPGHRANDSTGELKVPADMSVTARSRGPACTPEDRESDLEYLLQLWKAIQGASLEASGRPFLIYLDEASPLIRAIRDHFQSDIDEILIDTREIYEQVLALMQTVMPAHARKVKLYRGETPLFARFLA